MALVDCKRLRLGVVGVGVLLLSLGASADSVYTVEGGDIQTFQGGVKVLNPGDQPVTVIEKTDGSVVVKVNQPNSHITIQNPQGTDVDVEIEPTADGSSPQQTGRPLPPLGMIATSMCKVVPTTFRRSRTVTTAIRRSVLAATT